jgi:thiol-disulfide isomerase/thioredoxin
MRRRVRRRATTLGASPKCRSGTDHRVPDCRPRASSLCIRERVDNARGDHHALVDQAELTRRIEVYLEADLPDFSEAGRVANGLAPRLLPYIRPREEAPTASATLNALLPADALLFFGASWDGHTQRYRPTVQQAARRLGLNIIEIDVDDPVGSAIAAVFSVVATPTVALTGTESPVVGERPLDDLLASLGERTQLMPISRRVVLC